MSKAIAEQPKQGKRYKYKEMKTEDEIKQMAIKHFHKSKNKTELAIARLGYEEGFKAAQNIKKESLK